MNRILVVDDHEAVRSGVALAIVLRRLGANQSHHRVSRTFVVEHAGCPVVAAVAHVVTLLPHAQGDLEGARAALAGGLEVHPTNETMRATEAAWADQ